MTDSPEIQHNRPLPRVIAVANQKGGVGKTTTTVNLGSCLAEIGFRVLVVDLDPQGNASSALGINVQEVPATVYNSLVDENALFADCIESTGFFGLYLAPSNSDLVGVEKELNRPGEFDAHLRLKNAIDSVVEEWDLDFVLIDCPPALGILTINALFAASEVFVPVQCEGGFHVDALRGIKDLVNKVQKVNKSLEITTLIATMFDAKTNLSQDVFNDVVRTFGSKVCKNRIPRNVRLAEAVTHGQPINVYDPSSKGSIAYRLVAKEVAGGTSPRTR